MSREPGVVVPGGPLFETQEMAIAGAISAIAVLGFVGLFELPPPAPVRMDISDENRRPMAVEITPVALLKLGGGKTSTKVPSSWQRRTPPPPPKPEDVVRPSPQAGKTLDSIPNRAIPDASTAPIPTASSKATEPEAPVNDTAPAGSAPTAASGEGAAPGPGGEGSIEGVKGGTETDPLRARAIGRYREQLGQFFVARNEIRGKLPFDELKKLHAVATISITDERTVGAFSISQPSGNEVFDREVRATLERLHSSGTVLPPPPPAYADVLRETLQVRFVCNIESQCK